jgi:hypothetical protein
VLDGFHPRYEAGRLARAHDFGMWYFWNERGAHEYHFLWHAISKEIGIAEIELRPAIAPIGILAKQCHNLGIGGTFVPAWWEHSPEQGLSAVGVFVGMRAQDTQGGPAGPPLHWLPVHLRAAPLSQRHWTVDIKIRQSVNSRIPTQSTVAYGTTTLLLFLSMANPSRIQQSVLEPATISQHVELKWGWNRARSEFWHRGTNDTYRIEKDGKRAFLKLYRRGWRSRAEIQGEVDLLRFLRRKHASVSSPISTTTGAFIDQIDTRKDAATPYCSRGQRNRTEIQSRKQQEIRPPRGLDPQGRGLLPVSLRRPHLDIDYLVRESIERLRPHLAHRPRDLAFSDA